MSDDGGSRKVMSRRWRKRGHGKKSSEAIAPEGGKTDTADVPGSMNRAMTAGSFGEPAYFLLQGREDIVIRQFPCYDKENVHLPRPIGGQPAE